jgi:glutamate formiminotransferase
VPIGTTPMADCVSLAHRAGQRIWSELRIPVYYYAAAALRPDREKLEDVRRGQFEGIREAALRDPCRTPDVGGPGLHPTAGAVIVGARKVLIAYNINLRTEDLALAKQIARTVRASNGGLPGVKALGLPLPSHGLVQVSLNITDHELSPLHTVYAAVERLADAHGVEIAESELIGLLPRNAIETAAAAFLKLRDFNSLRVIENRLDSV